MEAFSFTPGDRLVFVTDGFVEAANAEGEPYGFERLETLLNTHASSDAATLKAAIIDAVGAHAGVVPPADDRTLVILTLQ
jgi:serine phosphatase RsbU (regulator of sigma subunit)